MNVLVLYQSRNGHTRAAAEAIAQAARGLSHDASIQSVIQVSAADAYECGAESVVLKCHIWLCSSRKCAHEWPSAKYGT